MSSQIDPRRRGRMSFTRDGRLTTKAADGTSHNHPPGGDSGESSASERVRVTKSHAGSTTRSEWMGTLHGACQTLCRTPGQVIGSISVTTRIADNPEAVWPLLDVARRIAEEYNVCAQARREAGFLTVRLQRQASDGDQIGSLDRRELTGSPEVSASEILDHGGKRRAEHNVDDGDVRTTTASPGFDENVELAAAPETLTIRGIARLTIRPFARFWSGYVVDDQPRTTDV